MREKRMMDKIYYGHKTAVGIDTASTPPGEVRIFFGEILEEDNYYWGEKRKEALKKALELGPGVHKIKVGTRMVYDCSGPSWAHTADQVGVFKTVWVEEIDYPTLIDKLANNLSKINVWNYIESVLL